MQNSMKRRFIIELLETGNRMETADIRAGGAEIHLSWD
jgi:hypothetical protein